MMIIPIVTIMIPSIEIPYKKIILYQSTKIDNY